MAIIIITGSAGLIGQECAKAFSLNGFSVIGIDNDMRSYFFGESASTMWSVKQMNKMIPEYTHINADIRDSVTIQKIFSEYSSDIKAVIHTAAQPSHDWAAREPMTDFSVNATGTMILLEATRNYAPGASFIFTSTNKVYGDNPNYLPLVEEYKRFELSKCHSFYEKGIDESMSVDNCLHSLFGASKLGADVAVQEYGRYFDMNTVCFRGGCLTGPGHSGAELHGFLAYLVKCVLTHNNYRILGYKGKQVRDNIHAFDLVACFKEFIKKPRKGEVYNIGGSRYSNCSMLEAIDIAEDVIGQKLKWEYVDQHRMGDHKWWISDVTKFQSHYPEWGYTYDIRTIIDEIADGLEERLCL